MVGIVKETGTVNKNSGIFISKKMIAELVVLLIVAVVAIAAMEIFQSPATLSNDLSTKQQQKNTQQTEQEAYTGTANPSQANNAGQETNAVAGTYIAGVYTPKFYPKGDTIYQGTDLNNIPAIIPFNNGKVYIKNMERKEDYLYGYLGATSARYNERVSFTWLGSNGKYMGSEGPFEISDEKESPFKIRTPPNAKYLVISNG